MVIEKEILIKKSADEVWKVLGLDFAHPYKWASAVTHSEGTHQHPTQYHCDERACTTVMGNLREKLTLFSPQNYELAYLVTEGMPNMVKTASNHWKLTPQSTAETHLKIQMDFDFKGVLGLIMQPMMRLKLSKIGDNMVEDFAYYVENGKPHPRKVKADSKIKK